MHTRRFLAAALGLLAAGVAVEAPPVLTVRGYSHLPQHKRQAFKKIRWGNSVPHQGKRECARRRGGQDWLNFRAADRISRGLPVSWPYQAM